MLKGKQVLLRSAEKRDVHFFHDMWSDEELRKYDGTYLIPPSKESVLENFNKIMNINKKYLSIINEKEVLVGYITYEEAKDLGGNYILGITIAKRFWNRGYGKDAIRTLLKFLFMSKGAHRIELEVVDFNDRAINCYLKCGFQKEGVRRKRYFSEGQYRDIIIMGILKEEYFKQNNILAE